MSNSRKFFVLLAVLAATALTWAILHNSEPYGRQKINHGPSHQVTR